MTATEFTNFFIASAGAGAALVGLLFVAVSIAPEHIVMANAPVDRQATASSSFTALLNAFFISLGALIPGSLNFITLVMSIVGLTNSLFLARNVLKERERWQNVLRRASLIAVSFAIYGYELYYAILLFNEPGNVGIIYTLTWLLLGVYAIGLTRSWQLLGARRFGFLGWLNPLRELNETMPITTHEESKTPSNPAHDEISQSNR